MIQLPSRAGELIDIRGIRLQPCCWISGDNGPHRGIGGDYPGSENRAGNEARERLAVALAPTFIREEIEAAVADEPAAEITAELVETKREPGGEHGIARIEHVVAQEFKQSAMQPIRAGLRGHIDLPSGRAAVFGSEEHGINAELVDGDGRNTGGWRRHLGQRPCQQRAAVGRADVPSLRHHEGSIWRCI